ncbi:hypothetical protein FMM05_15010 [Flavobacterium zepuense]|uniref:Lipocalin-like domain-containing protein n=1 Tax=Flavobacterium zepuense TaxID=2593302 RepID=A0A552UXP4_9FLAO|nr:hypothetical protein [Flavobacterium zepuense]TRW23004.1 hypothetical protein FMM05_15010 [Flavobacterium zepuense]
MKNLLYLFIACFTVAVASAQASIEKDLQGVWKLSEITVSGTTINVAASTITFSKEKEAQLTQQQRDAVKAKKDEAISNLKNSKITVSGTTIAFVIANMDRKGTFTVKPYSDAHILTIAYEDGSADEMVAYIKDKKLHLTKSDDANRDEMIFAK